MNTNDVTHGPRVTNQSAGYHVIPCEDFDDVIVNVNQYDNSVTSHNDTNEIPIVLFRVTNPII